MPSNSKELVTICSEDPGKKGLGPVLHKKPRTFLPPPSLGQFDPREKLVSDPKFGKLCDSEQKSKRL